MKHVLLMMLLFLLAYIPLYYFATDRLRRHLGPGFLLSSFLLTVAGAYAPDIVIFFAVMVIVLACTVQGRVEAVCRYILLAAIVPQMQWRIGAAGHYIGAVDTAGALAAAATVIALFDRRGAPRARRARWTVEDSLVVVAFLIMAVGGYGFGNINDTTRTWIMQYFLIATPYILFRTTIRTTEEFGTVIACFGAAAVMMAVFAVYESRLGANPFDVITKHLTEIYVRIMDIRGGLKRASATLDGPLEFACFMTIGTIALACSRRFFRNALGYYGSLGVVFIGMLAGQSRGSLIALFVAAIVLGLAMRKWGMAAAATVAGVAAWPTLKLLGTVSPAVASFLNGGAVPQAGQIDYRNLLLQRGLQVWSSHPLTGMRMPEVLAALSDITQGEGIVDLVNVYLQILLISGVVGFLPFVVLTLMSGVRGAIGFARINDQALRRVRGFTLAAYTVLLMQLSFVSFIGRIPMLFVLTLFGMRLLAHERRRLPLAAVRPVPAQDPATGPAPDPAPRRDGPDRDDAWIPRLPIIPA